MRSLVRVAVTRRRGLGLFLFAPDMPEDEDGREAEEEEGRHHGDDEGEFELSSVFHRGGQAWVSVAASRPSAAGAGV